MRSAAITDLAFFTISLLFLIALFLFLAILNKIGHLWLRKSSLHGRHLRLVPSRLPLARSCTIPLGLPFFDFLCPSSLNFTIPLLSIHFPHLPYLHCL